MSELNKTHQWIESIHKLTPDLKRLSAALIEEEYKELQEAFRDNDTAEVVDACGDLMVVISQLLYSIGVHPEKVLAAVNRSNESKFAKDWTEATISKQSYKDTEYADSIRIEPLDGGGYALYGSSDRVKNKLLKADSFTPPDFTDLEPYKADAEREPHILARTVAEVIDKFDHPDRYVDAKGNDRIKAWEEWGTEAFRGAMRANIDKYLGRLGKKDSIPSELSKIIVYALRWKEYEQRAAS